MIELLITILITLINPSASADTNTAASNPDTATEEPITAFGGTGTWIDK